MRSVGRRGFPCEDRERDSFEKLFLAPPRRTWHGSWKRHYWSPGKETAYAGVRYIGSSWWRGSGRPLLSRRGLPDFLTPTDATGYQIFLAGSFLSSHGIHAARNESVEWRACDGVTVAAFRQAIHVRSVFVTGMQQPEPVRHDHLTRSSGVSDLQFHLLRACFCGDTHRLAIVQDPAARASSGCIISEQARLFPSFQVGSLMIVFAL